MENFGLVTLPIVAVRSVDNERSELITQLLFGDIVFILDYTDKWLFIENKEDGYKGWVDRKMIQPITQQTFEKIIKWSIKRVYRPFSIINNTKTQEKMLIPAGSCLRNFQNGYFQVLDEQWFINEENFEKTNIEGGELLMDIAQQFLNAPYLWGGKTIFGIDCSGFVQTVFNVYGINLPRDSSIQIKEGKDIFHLKHAQTGDLAFFGDSESKITHIGILINNDKIMHASGWVKIETIDSNGIISNENGQYTHQLRAIKRVL